MVQATPKPNKIMEEN